MHSVSPYVYCFTYRRTLGYEDVLESLSKKGITIRVASPKLVTEEVRRSITLCDLRKLELYIVPNGS